MMVKGLVCPTLDNRGVGVSQVKGGNTFNVYMSGQICPQLGGYNSG